MALPPDRFTFCATCGVTQLPASFHKVTGIVALVAIQRDSPRAGNPLHHRQCRVALGDARCRQQFRPHDQTVAVCRQ